jgi:RNA polymerase sigma factor (sigma-70 family)
MKQLKPVTEEELLESLQSGDDRALNTIYRQHYQMVVNMVMNNGGSLQEAKDVYQEALIVFYEKIKEEDFELNCLIKTFVYSVSRRLWLKQLQRKDRFNGTLIDTDDFVELESEDVGEKEDQYSAMNHALEGLGEPCRSILKDFYLKNSSMEEITEKFGYTNADNAKNQKYKCLKRLKKQFFEVYKKSGGTNYDEQEGN